MTEWINTWISEWIWLSVICSHRLHWARRTSWRCCRYDDLQAISSESGRVWMWGIPPAENLTPDNRLMLAQCRTNVSDVSPTLSRHCADVSPARIRCTSSLRWWLFCPEDNAGCPAGWRPVSPHTYTGHNKSLAALMDYVCTHPWSECWSSISKDPGSKKQRGAGTKAAPGDTGSEKTPRDRE